MKRLLQLIAALVLVVAGPAFASPAAWAGDWGEPEDPPPTEPAEPPSDDGGTETGQVADCSAVAGPNYLGLACGSVTGGGLTVKQILGHDPVPGCWDEALTEAERAAMGLENTPGEDGSTWYWERCLHGIDHKTKTVQPGGVHFTIGVVSIDNGKPKKTLTDRQRRLVDFQGVDQQIPPPVAVTSPSGRPRVGADVSFFDPVDNQVQADAGAVQLTAQVTRMWVEPLGEGKGDAVTCPGTGHEAVRGDSPQTHPHACWYRYKQSSAGESATLDDQPAYPVLVTEEWTVTSSVGGGPGQLFTSFRKSQITALPVTEIQSLVIR